MNENEWLSKFVEKSLTSLRDLEDCFHQQDKEINRLKLHIKMIYGAMGIAKIVIVALIIYVAKKYIP